MGLDVPVDHVAAVQEGQAAGDIQRHLLAAVPPGQPVLVVRRQRFPQVPSLQHPRQDSRPVSCADPEHSDHLLRSAAVIHNACLTGGECPALSCSMPDRGWSTEKDTNMTLHSSPTEGHMEVASF